MCAVLLVNQLLLNVPVNSQEFRASLTYYSGPQPDLRTRRGKKARAIRDVWVPREKFEIQGLMNVFLQHFPWHFFRKSVLGKLEVHILLLSNTGAKLTTICILKHSNVFTRILMLKLNPAFTDFILQVIRRSLKIALQWRSQPLGLQPRAYNFYILVAFSKE